VLKLGLERAANMAHINRYRNLSLATVPAAMAAEVPHEAEVAPAAPDGLVESPEVVPPSPTLPS
jgi:hypothetical protein